MSIMWGNCLENYSDILSACDFSQAAFDIFKMLHLTEKEKPVSTTENALHFVYDSLPAELVLSKDERQILPSVIQISYLFDIDEFCTAAPCVRFFAVDLCVAETDRTPIQHIIHSLITRKAPYCSVVIFRNTDTLSISMSLHGDSIMKTIFASDWHRLYSAELDDMLTAIQTSLFSLKNGIAFVCDMVYLIARDYYIHPLSYEYLHYEQNTDEVFWQKVAEEYGDDFITDSFVEANSANNIDTTDEIDFDLIEYELEQMDITESEEINDEEDDDEFSRPIDPDIDEHTIDSRDIPPKVLADPVLLLEWLDKHSNDE